MAIVALVIGSSAGLMTAVSGWAFFEWSLAYAFLVYVIGGVLSLGICSVAMMLTSDTSQ